MSPLSDELKRLADKIADFQKKEDQDKFTVTLDGRYAKKWVERVIFWLFVGAAGTILGIVVKNLFTFFTTK